MSKENISLLHQILYIEVGSVIPIRRRQICQMELRASSKSHEFFSFGPWCVNNSHTFWSPKDMWTVWFSWIDGKEIHDIGDGAVFGLINLPSPDEND